MLIRYFINLFVFLYIFFQICDTSTNDNRSRIGRRRSILTVFYKNSFSYNETSSCRWLRGLRHQNKICRKQIGLPQVLVQARNFTKSTCLSQFQYDQWNCMTEKKQFSKLYRETAYMQALMASSIMYTVARACGAGTLTSCKCNDRKTYQEYQKSKFKWGGCGDNTKYAGSFTNRFLQLKRTNSDALFELFKNNCKIGMKEVKSHEGKVCKCIGLSASCTMRVCYKRLPYFTAIAQNLKNHYYNAIQTQPDNSIIHSTGHKLNEKRHAAAHSLLYTEKSPSFCPFTVGRRCKSKENCATLCCGRGYDTQYVEVIENCNCTIHGITVNCNKCPKTVAYYYCF